MAMTTDFLCKKCGCPLSLDVVDAEDTNGESLDITLECENECGAPVLNMFVSLSDFNEVTP